MSQDPEQDHYELMIDADVLGDATDAVSALEVRVLRKDTDAKSIAQEQPTREPGHFSIREIARYDGELAEQLQAAEDIRRRAEAEYKNFRMIWKAIRECGK